MIQRTFNASLEAIAQLDLRDLTEKLMEAKDWSLEQANEAVLRYRRFLTLHLRNPNHYLFSTSQIDIVWKEHIADTERYAKDCHHLFGECIDRQSCHTLTGWQRSDIEKTARLYRMYYGEDYLKMTHFSQSLPLYEYNFIQPTQNVPRPPVRKKLRKIIFQ